MSQRTCRLVTLDCKVNQYETQLVQAALERHGFREAEEDEAADLCVVNTCTVTNETGAEFEDTLESCRRARFMKIHCFPFSARKGTPAADFAEQIPPGIRRQRMQQLAALERTLARRYYKSQIGRTPEVLVEQVCGDRPGWVRRTDRHYIPVELPGDFRDVGDCVATHAVAAHAAYLEAQP